MKLPGFLLMFFTFPLFCGEIDWVDPPEPCYLSEMGIEEDLIAKLEPLLTDYLSLNRGCHAALAARIAALERVIDLIVAIEYEKPQEGLQALHSLKNMCLKKLRYFHTLVKNLESSEHDDQFQESHLIDSRFKPLFLMNERRFSFKSKRLWGDFWWETVDPCHRCLSPYLNSWEKEKIAGQMANSPENFFLWLESRIVPSSLPCVKYLDEEESLHYEAKVVDGRLCSSAGGPINTSQETRTIFALSLDKRLFLSSENRQIWHSSFTRGRPLLGAGAIAAERGVVTKYCIESGHYQPTISDGFQALTILREMGFSFTDPLEVHYYQTGEIFAATVPLRAFEDFHLFKQFLCNSSKRIEVFDSE